MPRVSPIGGMFKYVNHLKIFVAFLPFQPQVQRVLKVRLVPETLLVLFMSFYVFM